MKMQPSQNNDESGLIEREFSLGGLKNDRALAVAAITACANESIPKDATIGECIEGAFKVLFRGSWRKRDRHATCTGQATGGRRTGVLIRPTDH